MCFLFSSVIRSLSIRLSVYLSTESFTVRYLLNSLGICMRVFALVIEKFSSRVNGYFTSLLDKLKNKPHTFNHRNRKRHSTRNNTFSIQMHTNSMGIKNGKSARALACHRKIFDPAPTDD